MRASKGSIFTLLYVAHVMFCICDQHFISRVRVCCAKNLQQEDGRGSKGQPLPAIFGLGGVNVDQVESHDVLGSLGR